MKSINKYILGIILIILGVIVAINSTGLVDIDIFFDGWWTLFIIIPSLTGLISDEDKKGHLITLGIGIMLLLAMQNIISFDLVLKLILPLILIVIGLSLLFTERLKSDITKKIKETTFSENTENIVATFSEQKVKIDNEKFKGTNLDAIFGSITLDLTNATITKDCVIKASAIFGGITIKLPENISVKVKTTSLFGGVENKKKTSSGKITCYIEATTIFGGVTIK